MSNNSNNTSSNSINPPKRSESRHPSIASSETSETPSVGDDPGSSGTLGSRLAKIMKKQKEAERPPWRATISVAPKPTVDKNALLKAKLLEASRRIARAQLRPSVATQTDKKPTKLVKEVAIGVQKDLIRKRDQECLTDGTITVKDKSGNLLLTHSISQMTDAIQSTNFGTQTSLPRSSVEFNRHVKNYNKYPNANFEQIRQNDLRLRQQMNEIMKIDEKLNNYQSNNVEYKNIYKNDNLLNFSKRVKDYSDETDPDDNGNLNIETDSISDNEINSPKCSKGIHSPTKTNWFDLDFSSDEENYPQLPRRTVGRTDNPLNDLKDLIIGQRVSQMRLSPTPVRHRRPNLKQVTWSSDKQHRIISELVTEASALIDIFDQVTMLLGPDIKLNELPKIDDPRLPPLKMDTVLKNSCDLLEEKLNKIKPVNFVKMEKLDPELLKYAEGYNPETKL